MNIHGEFWRSALTSPLTLWCAALLLVTLAAAIVCILTLVRRGRLTRRPVSLWLDSDGTATIEFALVLPILLFTVLILTQTTTLMAGNLFVHYSAFAATRSAIVQIPLDTGDCPPNMYYPNTSKHEAILRSACHAVMPVCGPWTSGGGPIDPQAYVAAMGRFFQEYGQQPPTWVSTLAGEKLAYASANTTVDVLRATPVDSHTVRLEEITTGVVGPKDAVAVRVNHRLNLRMPYVNFIFADGVHPDGKARYMNIQAHAILTNEGLLDTMPPTPSIPRVP